MTLITNNSKNENSSLKLAVFPQIPKDNRYNSCRFLFRHSPNHQPHRGQPHRRVMLMCKCGYESSEEPTSEIHTKLYKLLVLCDLPKQTIAVIQAACLNNPYRGLRTAQNEKMKIRMYKNKFPVKFHPSYKQKREEKNYMNFGLFSFLKHSYPQHTYDKTSSEVRLRPYC